MVKRFLASVFLVLIFFIYGCATARTVSLKESVTPREGVYHKVRPKETLWRIAKSYGVSVEDVVRVNNIPNAAHIEENQLLLIPGPGTAVQKETIKKESPTISVSPVSSYEAFADDDFQWPIKGNVLSYFGEKRSLWINNGVDIKANWGQEVYPARGGEVVFSDFLDGYGYTVIVDHRDGYSTVYAQNAENLVSLGDFVKKDTAIAKAGGTETRSMLHFEVRKDAVAKNPLYFLP